MDLVTFDIKTICRICLDCPTHQVSLWEDEKFDRDISKQLVEILEECTSVKVEKDGILSDIICTDCLVMLMAMYRFRKKCIDTNDYLNKFVLKLNKKRDMNLTPKSESLKDDNKFDIEEDVNYGTMSEYFLESDVELADPMDSITLQASSEDLVVDPLIINPKQEQQEFKVEKVKKEIRNRKAQKCNNCNKFFAGDRALIRHYFYCASKAVVKLKSNDAMEELVETSLFPCDICHIQLETMPKLVEHFYRHVAISSYFDFKHDEDLFFCYACNVKQLNNEVEFCKHLSAHSIYTCNTCQKSYNNQQATDIYTFKKHLKTHGVFPKVCQICLISFPTKEEAESHVKNHLQVDSKSIYECALCYHQFLSCSELKEHIKIHSEGVDFCSECGMAFTDLLKMESHKEMHKNEGNYLCPTCGSRFQAKFKFDQHLLRHNESLKISCDICHKTLSSISSLNSHKKIHTNIKPFTCSVPDCNYACFTSSDLKQHSFLKHTKERPYNCKFFECSDTFRTLSHLAVHIKRAHTGERNHPCSICDRKFVSSVDLRKHAITHTDLRPHSCDICGKSFRRRFYVGVHKEKMHKNTIFQWK